MNGRRTGGHRVLRIIGGKWRGRKVSFAPHAEIRPTPNRIRETLFNWLQIQCPNAHCLELYAGSGILSIEALSRGAAHATIVDHSAAAIAQIEASLASLAEHGDFDCVRARAVDWLRDSPAQFDLVFIDPPFDSDEIPTICRLLESRIKDDGLVYIESPEAVADQLPDGWHEHRSAVAGRVHYGLWSPG